MLNAAAYYLKYSGGKLSDHRVKCRRGCTAAAFAVGTTAGGGFRSQLFDGHLVSAGPDQLFAPHQVPSGLQGRLPGLAVSHLQKAKLIFILLCSVSDPYHFDADPDPGPDPDPT